VHAVQLSAYWISETPISWSKYCELLAWEPPPEGYPAAMKTMEQSEIFRKYPNLYGENKIRLQYCEDYTTRAIDWHAHARGQQWKSGKGIQSSQELFGWPPRSEPDRPWTYGQKPLIAVAWKEAVEFAQQLQLGTARFSLPSEAQWEKAARGGLIGCMYPWGDELATDRCDCDRFRHFSILATKTYAANAYGLFAMSGGVWEWTLDTYCSDGYARFTDLDPINTEAGDHKVLRGGSWADPPEVATVSFRNSLDSSWSAANAGFRLCRTLTN